MVIACIAYDSRFHIMVHVKWPSPSFKVDLDHEIDNIMKNDFYQRILQPSEHPKRVGAKKIFFQNSIRRSLMINMASLGDSDVSDQKSMLVTFIYKMVTCQSVFNPYLEVTLTVRPHPN